LPSYTDLEGAAPSAPQLVQANRAMIADDCQPPALREHGAD
jgi:hypothetical protein